MSEQPAWISEPKITLVLTALSNATIIFVAVPCKVAPKVLKHLSSTYQILIYYFLLSSILLMQDEGYSKHITCKKVSTLLQDDVSKVFKLPHIFPTSANHNNFYVGALHPPRLRTHHPKTMIFTLIGYPQGTFLKVGVRSSSRD